MKPMYVIILVILVAAVGFYSGTTYQKSHGASYGAAGGQAGGGYGGGAGGFASGMTPLSGKIISQGNGSITVQLPDGSSKIVDFTSQTKIMMATTGTASDLKSGTRVTAFGTTNSDGSITAQNISIGNGMFRGRGGNGRQGGQQ